MAKTLWVDFILLLRIVRWYNIALIGFAQYLIAIFAFATPNQYWAILTNYKIFCIVVSTLLTTAGAFIINSFYDIDKDLINKPNSVIIKKLLGQNIVLNVYFIFNLLALTIALIASYRVLIFTCCLVFFFWFYSHKLQKIPLVREISASLLALSGLIAICLYFNQFHLHLFVYLSSLGVVFFTREIIKDFQGNMGNAIFGYQTVVVLAGEREAKKWLLTVNLLITISFILGFLIWIQYWSFYSIIAALGIASALFMAMACFFAKDSKNYHWLDVFLKITIVFMVLSLFKLGLNN